MVGPFTYIKNVMPIVDTVILYPVIPFINVTEIKCTHTRCTSLLTVSLRLAGKVNSSKNWITKEVSTKRGLDT